MTIEVKVVEHSISESGKEVATLQLHYPLFIHAQVMTHRVFSRGAASNRAIPIKKLVKRTLEDPVYPTVYGSNKSGMQAGGELSRFKKKLIDVLYWTTCRVVCYSALLAGKIGLHKQHANRLMMGFQHIDVILTSTEWDNFFKLRVDHASQPEIQELAIKIRDVLGKSTPKLLKEGEWHTPYVTDKEKVDLSISEIKDISAARCARVSYLTHDNKRPDIDKDLRLASDLFRDEHMSPFEHVCTPTKKGNANLKGWQQYRYQLERIVK